MVDVDAEAYHQGLGLSPRIVRILLKQKISVARLQQMSAAEIRQIDGIGVSSLKQIRSALARRSQARRFTPIPDPPASAETVTDIERSIPLSTLVDELQRRHDSGIEANGRIDLTIGYARPMDTHGAGITIRITCSSSRRRVCDIDLSAATLIQLLSGLSLTGLPVQWVAPDRIGWRASSTAQVVARKRNESWEEATERVRLDILDTLEDGAEVTVRQGDVGNSHRRRKIATAGDRAGAQSAECYDVVFFTLSPPPKRSEP